MNIFASYFSFVSLLYFEGQNTVSKLKFILWGGSILKSIRKIIQNEVNSSFTLKLLKRCLEKVLQFGASVSELLNLTVHRATNWGVSRCSKSTCLLSDHGLFCKLILNERDKVRSHLLGTDI